MPEGETIESEIMIVPSKLIALVVLMTIKWPVLQFLILSSFNTDCKGDTSASLINMESFDYFKLLPTPYSIYLQEKTQKDWYKDVQFWVKRYSCMLGHTSFTVHMNCDAQTCTHQRSASDKYQRIGKLIKGFWNAKVSQ